MPQKREEVKIKSSGGWVAFVTPKSAQGYLRHGWTLVDDGSSEPETEKKPAKKTTSSRKAE